MDNLSDKKVIDAYHVFDDRFMKTKALYLYHFNTLPNVNFVNRIDGKKHLPLLMKSLARISGIYTGIAGTSMRGKNFNSNEPLSF